MGTKSSKLEHGAMEKVAWADESHFPVPDKQILQLTGLKESTADGLVPGTFINLVESVSTCQSCFGGARVPKQH